MTREDLKPDAIVRHVRTGGLYTVLGVGFCSTHGSRNGELSVVYRSNASGELYYRTIEEFCDGRFVTACS